MSKKTLGINFFYGAFAFCAAILVGPKIVFASNAEAVQSCIDQNPTGYSAWNAYLCARVESYSDVQAVIDCNQSNPTGHTDGNAIACAQVRSSSINSGRSSGMGVLIQGLCFDGNGGPCPESPSYGESTEPFVLPDTSGIPID